MKYILTICGREREYEPVLRELSPVIASEDALGALEAAAQYDVGLLIAGCPQLAGEAGRALLRLRREKDIPLILALSRRDEISRAAELGADDYLLAPFTAEELASRAAFRLGRETAAENDGGLIRAGGLTLDPLRRRFEAEGRAARLTPTEYRILELLCLNRGKIFSASEIYCRVWNESFAAGDNSVAVHIRHIREKIEENPKRPKFIKSVWSAGYKVE